MTELWFCWQKWVRGARLRMMTTARSASATKKILGKMSRYQYSARKVHITLRYVTLRYVTLHYVTLRYVALHNITLHYILTLLSFQSALFPVRDIFCCIRCTLKYSILLNPESAVYFLSKLRFVLTILWGFSCDCRLLFWFNLFFFSQFVPRKQKHSLSFLEWSEEYSAWV